MNTPNKNLLIKSNLEINTKISFFLRHENDLDFLMPIILVTKNAKIIFWKKINKKDHRINFLRNNKYEIFFLNYFTTPLLFKIFIHIIKKISFKLSEKIDKLFLELELLTLFFTFKKNIKSFGILNFNVIAFDHVSDKLSRSIISLLKNYNKSFKFISLPHGVKPFKNFITDSRMTKKIINYNYNLFDYVICSDLMQSSIIHHENKIIIGPLRYTKEYLNFYNSYINNKKINSEIFDKNKKNIFFIHSKFFGNINKMEFLRFFKILDNYFNIKLIIKRHPRCDNNELKILNSYKNVLITDQHIIKLINESDYVICIQSIAIYDALIIGKTVICPTYMTTNIIDPEILDYCVEIKSSDDMLNIIEKISKNNFNPYLPKFLPTKFDLLFDKWKWLLEKKIFE